MALQPNMQVLNQAFRTAAQEIEKFPNIPAIDQGNAILEEIRRLNERIDNRFDQLQARLQAVSHPLAPLVHTETGDVIENFPVNVRAIQDMRGPELNRILQALGQAENGNVVERRERLIVAVGVVMQAFSDDIPTEAEVFLMLLIKIVLALLVNLFLSPEEPATTRLRTVHDMLANRWPTLLAALSFYISTNLSVELLADILGALRSLITSCVVLRLTTPRGRIPDQRFKAGRPETSCLKSGLISRNRKHRSLLFCGQPNHPGLSWRAIISSALFLAGSLGPSWFDVLEAIQNADYVLTKGTVISSKKAYPMSSAPSSGRCGTASNAPAPPRHPALVDLDADAIQHAIQRLLDSTKNLEDDSFRDFVAALCKLSAEMVGMQAVAEQVCLEGESAEDSPGPKLTPQSAYAHRRRASGIALPRTMRTGDIGINVARTAVTTHLLVVIRHPQAPQSIRLQAARILNEILVIVPRNLNTAGDIQGHIQARVLNALSQQVSIGTSVDIRRMGLEPLHLILQSSAHTFVTGWELIFEMLASVCKLQTQATPKPLPSDSDLSTVSEPPTPRRPTPLQIGEKRISDERVEGIWHQILDVFKGVQQRYRWPLDNKGQRRILTLALLATLEIDTPVSWSRSSSSRSSRCEPGEVPETCQFDHERQSAQDGSSHVEGNGHVTGTIRHIGPSGTILVLVS
ncbi:hypothetical protein JB92DRAFT_2829153 [Gautieria morchelliformis]|nr:hypothetical protein JB92DRAFT_2829153 [Gautieria morchelliformis]